MFYFVFVVFFCVFCSSFQFEDIHTSNTTLVFNAIATDGVITKTDMNGLIHKVSHHLFLSSLSYLACLVDSFFFR